MNNDWKEIIERKYYKQSAPTVGITILTAVAPLTLAANSDLSDGLWFLNAMMYVSPNRTTYGYWPIPDGKKAVLSLFDRMARDPQWVKKQLRKHARFSEGLEKRSLAIAALGTAFSDKIRPKCIQKFKEFADLEFKRWACALFIDLFDPFEKETLEFIFGNRLGQINPTDLQILLLPDKIFLWDEQRSLEKIRKEFEKSDYQKTAAIVKMISIHTKKFWWIENNYQTATRLNEDFFFNRLNEPRPHETWKGIQKKKQSLIQKYGFGVQTQNRLQQFADLAFFRDERKKFTNIANYGITRFFYGIASAQGIPLAHSEFVIPFLEYDDFVNGNSKLLATLAERSKKGVWLIATAKAGEYLVETTHADELFERIENAFSGEGMVYGTVASMGKTTGPAKIVLNVDEFTKFQPGDILITGMTRPEFVPLMKKASAIVTDEGGITSHAAIISRELGKPCIIGTQVATKTFKDGEIIEVNADHGFIRKTEQSK